MWLNTFHAQDPGTLHGAPTTNDTEEVNELYSKEHGNEAQELHRSEDALFLAWQDEENLKLRKLRELIQAKERAPSTPTPPNGSHKASLPDSALFPPVSPPLSGLREAASKTTKTR